MRVAHKTTPPDARGFVASAWNCIDCGTLFIPLATAEARAQAAEARVVELEKWENYVLGLERAIRTTLDVTELGQSMGAPEVRAMVDRLRSALKMKGDYSAALNAED